MINVQLEDVFDSMVITSSIKYISRKNKNPGYDGISAKELNYYWKIRGDKIMADIFMGKYKPEPLMEVMISKRNKKEKRKIEISSVIDRMIQHSLSSVLSPYYEELFIDNSFAFRKGKNTYDAVKKVTEYFNEGYCYCALIDIKNFYDMINHECLQNLLIKEISDERLIKLIFSYIKIKIKGRRYEYIKSVGISQGNALSPLLANIYLNEYDHFMDKQGYRYVRYADDILVMCDSKAEAKKVISMTEDFVSGILKLHINIQKTKIVNPEQCSFLGFSFVYGKNAKYVAIPSVESKAVIEERILKIFKREKSGGKLWNLFGAFNRGWLNYYMYVPAEYMHSYIDWITRLQKCLLYRLIEEYGIDEVTDEIITNCNYISSELWYAELEKKMKRKEKGLRFEELAVEKRKAEIDKRLPEFMEYLPIGEGLNLLERLDKLEKYVIERREELQQMK